MTLSDHTRHSHLSETTMKANESRSLDVLVVGCGIAGLSAAVAARQAGATVAILERAPIGERGGNTRYTEAFMRMKSLDEVADDFESHFAANAGGHLDPELVAETAADYANWPGIVKSLGFVDPEVITSFGVHFDFFPTPFLTTCTTRMGPRGGGLALVEALAAAAENLGVAFHYETTAQDLLLDDEGAVTGVVARGRDGKRLTIRARSVVLGSGGYEGNSEMMTRYVGPRSLFLRPVARGGYYNKGEGIAMALRHGAAPCGDFGSYHAEPVDPRSGRPEPAIFIFSYGILVNQEGRRFVDEAPGTVDATYESITRRIYEQTDGLAYVILDARVHAVPNKQLAIRTDQPAIEADSIAGLARKLKIPPAALERTVAEYNGGCRPAPFTPLQADGHATTGIEPPKTNWAHPIDTGPYLAYPIMSSNVFTFGGLKVNANAQVVAVDGNPITGLYAAGEVVGLYYRVYTGATSVLKGAVFGRLAGLDAARRAAKPE